MLGLINGNEMEREYIKKSKVILSVIIISCLVYRGVSVREKREDLYQQDEVDSILSVSLTYEFHHPT